MMAIAVSMAKQGHDKNLYRLRRHRRIRSRVFGTVERPRLSVFRSNRHIYAQAIDDASGVTLCAASDLQLKCSKRKTKTEIAYEVGKAIASKLKKQSHKRVVFDRGGYLYHGRVRKLADGAREVGLEF